MSAFREHITAQFNCSLFYSAAFSNIIIHLTQFNHDFMVPWCEIANKIRSWPTTEKPFANKEIRVIYNTYSFPIYIYRKREFNRRTNRGMFLPVPLFTLGFAPLAVDVRTDGQFLCKHKRQPRRLSTVKSVYAKYYNERNF